MSTSNRNDNYCLLVAYEGSEHVADGTGPPRVIIICKWLWACFGKEKPCIKSHLLLWSIQHSLWFSPNSRLGLSISGPKWADAFNPGSRVCFTYQQLFETTAGFHVLSSNAFTGRETLNDTQLTVVDSCYWPSCYVVLPVVLHGSELDELSIVFWNVVLPVVLHGSKLDELSIVFWNVVLPVVLHGSKLGELRNVFWKVVLPVVLHGYSKLRELRNVFWNIGLPVVLHGSKLGKLLYFFCNVVLPVVLHGSKLGELRNVFWNVHPRCKIFLNSSLIPPKWVFPARASCLLYLINKIRYYLFRRAWKHLE